MKDDLQILIKSLPYQLKFEQYGCNDKKNKILLYDLIIFRYRNTVQYSRLEYTNKNGLKISDKLIEFYDGELIDNIKKMINYLKENNFMEIYDEIS